jgi:orotidine-5'-phosphate decarboxylase
MTHGSLASAKLARLVAERGPTCLGFDPRLDWAPPEFRPRGPEPEAAAEAIVGFFDAVIEAAGADASAVKLQAAFFERWLTPGFAAFERCCRTARERGLFVLADVKRGDIGTTSEAYAEAYLAPVGGRPPLADAVTISPYLGTDGLKPFYATAERNGGLTFTLVKTSNPSSKELQDLVVDGRTVAERVAAVVEAEAERTAGGGAYGGAGAVVGATHPAELGRFRRAMPHAWLLLPGYGAQGAGAADVRDAFDAEGGGALVAASRSLNYPWGAAPAPTEWRAAIRDAARAMRADLGAALRKKPR